MKQPKIITPVQEAAQEESHRLLLPQCQVFNHTPLLSMDSAEPLQVHTPEPSSHAQFMQVSLLSHPPHTDSAPPLGTHSLQQDQEGECGIGASRPLNYSERMEKHCKGISAIPVLPQALKE